jgi:hypothetical protein
MADGQSPFKISQELRDALIARAIETPTIRRRLGESLAMPLRNRMDYQSVARKTFIVDQLPGFHCAECGFHHADKDHVHSDEECLATSVHVP